jgi:hypothetical protein
MNNIKNYMGEGVYLIETIPYVYRPYNLHSGYGSPPKPKQLYIPAQIHDIPETVDIKMGERLIYQIAVNRKITINSWDELPEPEPGVIILISPERFQQAQHNENERKRKDVCTVSIYDKEKRCWYELKFLSL